MFQTLFYETGDDEQRETTFLHRAVNVFERCIVSIRFISPNMPSQSLLSKI